MALTPNLLVLALTLLASGEASAKRIDGTALPASHCVRPDGLCSIDREEIQRLTAAKFMATIKPGYSLEDFVEVGCHSGKLQGYGTGRLWVECLVWYGLAPKSNPNTRVDVPCNIRYDLDTGLLSVLGCKVDAPKPETVSLKPGNISVPYRTPVSKSDI